MQPNMTKYRSTLSTFQAIEDGGEHIPHQPRVKGLIPIFIKSMLPTNRSVNSNLILDTNLHSTTKAHTALMKF